MKITLFISFLVGFTTIFAQNEAVSKENTSFSQRTKDSLLLLKPAFNLSPEFYKERYNGGDLTYKITDNRGNGFDALYGTRNLRPILYGVAYRGGANNYYHKTAKRNNHNPLPNDGIENLCKEGFSSSVYLYQENFETAPSVDTCACVNKGVNKMDYYQYDYFNNDHIYEMLKLVHRSAINDSVGPVYLHCWNGWHASGLLSALVLRQFCGFSKWDAINYWDINTDGANNSPRYQTIRNMIKEFEPYEEFMITDELGNRICPPMPKFIDSSEIHVEIEHLVYVPESIPIGFDIVLHNTKFASGKTTLAQAAKNEDLQNLLLAFKQQPALKVEIGGYTDNSGSAIKNKQLSAQRAKFVYDFLIKNGVAANKLSYKGYGPVKPIYSNKYKSTRAGNRRIEIKILDKKVDNLNKLVDDNTNSSVSLHRFTLTELKNNLAVLAVNEIVKLDSVIFAPSSVEISAGAKTELNILAKILQQNTTLKGEIAGHTDKSGLEELNQVLSKQRAEAVYNYLIAAGVRATQLVWKGYGSAQPMVSNKYQYGRNKNRRIEFKILSK